MTSSLLILDAHCLCHRNWHAMTRFNTFNFKYPVIYGFLRDLGTLNRVLDSKLFAFCFDEGESKRKDLYPLYKANREPKPDSFLREMESLRKEVLPACGYKNIFSIDGYEADDLIGFIVREVRNKTVVHIVSSDSDMYQLLGKHTHIWNPQIKATITLEWLQENHNLTPAEWVTIKAMTGCKTDNIEGIKSVGPGTAYKYLRNELANTSISFKRISESYLIIARNIRLVKLPFDQLKTPDLTIQRDEFDPDGWNRMCSKYDCDILTGKYP